MKVLLKCDRCGKLLAAEDAVVTDDACDYCRECARADKLEGLKQRHASKKEWLDNTHLKYLREMEKEIAEMESVETKTDPSWGFPSPGEDGCLTCKKCGKSQSETFSRCVWCCPHDTLNFGEEWDCGWNLKVVCAACGKNFDFKNSDLISDYKAVRAPK